MWRFVKIYPFQKIGNIYFHGNRKKNKIALTFDDGPSQETLKVLDVLKKGKCGATFFILGKRIKGREKIIKSIVKGGYEIGNHSFNHLNLNNKSSKRIIKEIIDTDKKLAVKTKIFRPPYYGLGINLYRICKKLNKKIIIADVFSEDWNKERSNEEIINNLLNKIKNGSIIGFHDYAEEIGRNKRIIKILKKIMPELKKKYKLVTISELLNL